MNPWPYLPPCSYKKRRCHLSNSSLAKDTYNFIVIFCNAGTPVTLGYRVTDTRIINYTLDPNFLLSVSNEWHIYKHTTCTYIHTWKKAHTWKWCCKKNISMSKVVPRLVGKFSLEGMIIEIERSTPPEWPISSHGFQHTKESGASEVNRINEVNLPLSVQ